MMDSIDRSSIASRSSTSRPQTRWRRGGAEHQQSELDQPPPPPPRPATAKTTVSSSGGADRPSSRRGIKSLAHDVSSMSSNSSSSNGTTGGMQRPPTSAGRMSAAGLSRPPSAAARASMSGLPIGAASLSRHQLHSMLDRPVTQQGLAGVRRSASSKGVPRLARQMQDKKYYEQLLQSKIRELEQQMASIRRDMEAASGGGASTSRSQGQSTRGLLANRLQELQAQLDEYNAVLDKMNSGWYRENAQADLYSENPAGSNGNYDSARHEAGASSQELDIIQLFQKRQRLDSAYNKIQWNLNANRKLAKRIVESMDADARKRSKLPGHIPLSPMKLEACRLYQRIFEDDGKDKLDLAATRKQIAELEKRTAEAQEELQQLEQCIEEAQAEGNFKFHDSEGRSGSDGDRVYSSKLQKSRAEELQRLGRLEDEIVERLERATSSVNANFDSDSLSNDELELLQTLMDMDSENSQDKTIDELRQDNAKLAALSARLAELEAKIAAEMAAVERKRPSLLAGPNNRTFDSSGDSEIYGEMTEEDALDEQRLLVGLSGDRGSGADLDEARLDYDLLKEKIETNDVYRPISILEDKLRIAGAAYDNGNDKSSGSIVSDETATSDEQLLEKLFKLASQYNQVLIKELKTIF
ncbi:hypothetical protein TKK_0005989 [Trichogramma kaykai]|uniref:Uncharacterized protein n=1 Tax=Trichogramma kaykai TaxID=54128 RepID=A0ABD2XHB9_9HYME